jgi:hypothetical protein
MRPFTDEEFKELPHILWTSEDNWDPTSLDSVISDDPNWYEVEPSPPLPNPMYDEYGEFRGRVLINQREWQVHYFDALDTKPSSGNDEFHNALEQFADDPDSVINLVVYRANRARYICDHDTVEAAPKFVMTSEPDYGQLCPRLGWLPIDTIKKTFECTTQLARMPMSTILKKRYDISPLLCFHFWEPVYYKLDDSDFPSDSREKRGHFVGISESVGHAMTFKILTDDTLKVIH